MHKHFNHYYHPKGDKDFVRTYKAMKEVCLSVQNRIDKASLFTSITGLLRGQSTETLYKVSWVLAMRRDGSLTLQHFAWEREQEVFRLLEDMVQITPGKLLPKGLTGYYSVAPSVTIAIHELVDLVRDLKVIGVLQEDDA